MEPKQMTAGSGETGRWRASRQRAGRPRVLPGAKNRAGGNRARGRQPVYRKSDSAIMVMKAAEDGRRYDAAHVLDGAINRSVLVERPMSPQLIIISGILRQYPAQVLCVPKTSSALIA